MQEAEFEIDDEEVGSIEDKGSKQQSASEKDLISNLKIERNH